MVTNHGSLIFKVVFGTPSKDRCYSFTILDVTILVKILKDE